MIDKTQELVDVVNELHAAIDDLPNLKNIEINIVGDAEETLRTIKADISSLESRTVEVNIVYKNIGGPEDIKNATQVVNQVVIPANDTIKEQTQLVKDVNVGSVGDGGLNPGLTDQAATAMHDYANEVSLAAERTRQLAADSHGATDSVANLDAMTEKAAENVNKVAQSVDNSANAAKTAEAAQNALAAEINKSSLSYTRQMDIIMALQNANTVMKNTDDLLSASFDMLYGKAQQAANGLNFWRSALDAAGVGTAYFDKQIQAGAIPLVAFGDSARKVGDSVGGILIPLSAASFGITGLATAIHLIVMGSFEFLAVFIPAMYAAGAAALVMMQGVQIVSRGLSSMYTAAEALGPMVGQTAGDMLGLGHSLQTAQNMANPGVYELLGETIMGLQSQTKIGANGLSAFGQTGLAVEHIMEGFGAKVVTDLNSSSGQIHQLLAGAVADLVMFGQIIGNIGHAMLNFASAMPGLAEVLLKIVDAISAVIKWLSQLPPWLLTTIMVIEEMYRWSGLLVGVFGLLGRAIALVGTLGIPIFAKIGTNFLAMADAIAQGVAGAIMNFGLLTERVLGSDSKIVGSLANVAAKVSESGGGWIAAAAIVGVAVAAIVISVLRWKDATQQWIDTEQKAVSAASNLTVLNVIGDAMAQTAAKIAQNQAAANLAMANYNATGGLSISTTNKLATGFGIYGTQTLGAAEATQKAGNSLGPYNSAVGTTSKATAEANGYTTAFGGSISATTAKASTSTGVYQGYAGAVGIASGAIQELTGYQKSLVAQFIQVSSGAGTISKEFGTSFASSLAIADIAGVNLDKTTVKFGADANQAGIQIAGLVLGYQKMGQTGTILSNSMAAVNVQAGLQQTKVQQLNSAWDSFMSMATSLTGSFSQILLNLQQMGNSAPAAGAKIQAFSGTTQLSVGQIAQSLHSVNATSAQTWQAWGQSLQSAQTWTDNLRTAAAAGAVTQTQYKQGVAGVVAQLLPYAKDSQTARDQLSVLVQEAGGPGVTSFQGLTKWVQQTGGATVNMSSLIQTLTGKLSNVTGVAKTFAGTLQSDVLNAMAAAGANMGNITKLTDNYTTALQSNARTSPQVKGAQDALTASLTKYGFDAQSITQIEQILANQYGQTTDATKKTTQATNDAGAAADSLRASHLAPLQNGLDQVKAHTDSFNTTMHPGTTDAMDKLSGAVDSMRVSHLSPAQTAIDQIKAHTDDFGRSMDPGLTNSVGTTASRMDEWRGSHLGPAQTAIDQIKTHTDIFGQAMHPGLTGKLDTAGARTDNLHNQHLSPLQQIVSTLKQFVNDFERSMSNWPSSEHTKVTVAGTGSTKINSTIPGVSGGTINLSGAGLGLSTGGVLPGFAPGIDTIPAMLSPGEGVLVPEAVRALGGADVINNINRGYRQHFDSGGIALPNVTKWAEDSLGQSTTSITNGFKAVLTAAINAMQNQATQLASGPAGGATGSEMANGAELYQYLLKNVFQGHKIAAAGAIASIWGESTWNPFSINCVPLTYKVVTTRGVLAHDEVRIGDRTPVYNPRTGHVEDAEILDVPYHYDAQICRLGNLNWSVICTWDHKWITDEGLVQAQDMHPGTKVLLGDGRWEIIEFAWDMGYDDTFCLTTTTGTWTTMTDEGDVIWTGNSNGRGLIGWTPQGTISNAAFAGGMRTQEPAIIQFINTSGDWGVIREMMSAGSVFQAANEWGVGVERFGINDVHPEGVALATSIMNSGGGTSPQALAPAQGLARAINHAARSTQDAGGWIYPGMNIVHNGTGQIERTYPPGEGPGGGVIHNVIMLDGKQLFEGLKPYVYQYDARNNGNGNITGAWRPR